MRYNIHLSLPKRLYNYVLAQAEKLNLSRSGFIKTCIEQHYYKQSHTVELPSGVMVLNVRSIDPISNTITVDLPSDLLSVVDLNSLTITT